MIRILAAFGVDEGLAGSVEEEDITFGVTAGGIPFGAKTESNL